MHPECRGIHHRTAIPNGRHAALGPTTPDAAAKRREFQDLAEDGELADFDDHAAHDPRHRIRNSGVTRIVVGDVLEIARERIEAEPPARADVSEAHFLTTPEESPTLRYRHHLALGVHP